MAVRIYAKRVTSANLLKPQVGVESTVSDLLTMRKFDHCHVRCKIG